MMKQEINYDEGPTIEFKKVSVHKATTFTGLCSDHDTQIFRPIDIKPIDISDKEQLFLLAYRSVFKEMTTLIQAALMNQLSYLKKVDLDLVSGDVPSLEGMVSLKFISNAYEFYIYKKEFDLVFINNEFDKVTHYSFVLENVTPTFAVSSVFTPIELANRKNDIERVILNIFPYDSKMYVIFSCLSSDLDFVKPHFLEIQDSGDYYQKYLISKLVLRNCENFVISPRYYSTFTEKKKEVIKKFFTETIFSDLINFEDPDLFLF